MSITSAAQPTFQLSVSVLCARMSWVGWSVGLDGSGWRRLCLASSSTVSFRFTRTQSRRLGRKSQPTPAPGQALPLNESESSNTFGRLRCSECEDKRRLRIVWKTYLYYYYYYELSCRLGCMSSGAVRHRPAANAFNCLFSCLMTTSTSTTATVRANEMI